MAAVSALLSVTMGSAAVHADDGASTNPYAVKKVNILQDPYSPLVGHAYRHGVLPTVEGVRLSRQWKAANFVAGTTAAATGPDTLSYLGGDPNAGGAGVMDGTVKVYVVFYGNQWGTQSTDANGNLTFSGDPDGTAPVTQKFFKDIGTGGELWSAGLTQWCDGPNVSAGATSCPNNASFVPYQTGGVLAGVWYDNSAASPAEATALQLAQEADAAAKHFGNTTAASNRYAYYVILSPHGTNPDDYKAQTSGDQGYCAWHDWDGDGALGGAAPGLDGSGGGTGSPDGAVAFSNQPYNVDNGATCGVNFVNSGAAGTLDGYTMTLGHEWQEMMSDTFPYASSPTATTFSGGGWYNQKNGENGDECAWRYSFEQGGAANVQFGNDTFAEQSIWSNDTNECDISHPIVNHSAGSKPVANFGDTVSGLTVNFTNSSTDTGGTISSYAWNFGDNTTSTVASPSHTYAAAGTYTVTLTVTDNTGATNTKTASVTVSSGGTTTGNPVANFTDTVSGLTATFTNSSTDTGGTINAYAWNFGDGSTSTVASPSHAYAAAGTYSVSLKVTDNTGATNTKTGSVTVTAPTGRTFSNNTAVAIGDDATVTSPITVSGISGDTKSTIQVHVNITSNMSGDLGITITAPDGSSATLKSPDFTTTGSLNTTYSVPATGVLANGTWTVTVTDYDFFGNGDSSTLNSWNVSL
ncbi:PKD domain-containing protein [Dyella acidisoli]|uniref:PKD domain-containing protein n=1 Tax=Dyella acidisoli TaxID=1867834 RepID=A0ABQ5XPH4_9GAMM|nr:PKD domain-containing protein [Dyella acidisoli]GLQ93099.1 hypothetical protein GCM10007901_20500 [Dyella acidisoli]